MYVLHVLYMPRVCLPLTCVLAPGRQVWEVAIALYLVGALVWNFFSTGERVFD